MATEQQAPPQEQIEDALAKLTRPVDLEGWERVVREHYEFLAARS